MQNPESYNFTVFNLDDLIAVLSYLTISVVHNFYVLVFNSHLFALRYRYSIAAPYRLPQFYADRCRV